MNFINPCKTCITRPVCRGECDEFIDYGCNIHDVTFISWIIFLFVVFVSVFVVLYLILNPLYVSGILISILCFGYYKAAEEIFSDMKDFKRHKIWQQGVMCIFGPFLLLGSISWQYVPIDPQLDNFIYKYNKKVK